jgi:tellurite resistance protein
MLDHLSAEEQRALLELLIYLAKSDGTVADIEEEILHQYADLVEVEFDELDGNLTPAELVPQFEGPASCVVVLQELLRLSHLDGYFAADEQAAILDIAQQMEIPVEMLEKIDRWVVEGLNWVWRGEELLEEAEALAD